MDPLSPDEAQEFRFPGSWQECTIGQLGTIAALTSAPRPKPSGDPDVDHRAAERAEAHLRLALLRELSAMPVRAFLALDPTDLLTVTLDELGAERVSLLPQIDWCMAPPCFAISLLPYVSVRRRLRSARFQGPSDRLGKFSLHQWGFADMLLAKLQVSGREEDMNNLLGALYHDVGTPWDAAGIEARGTVLSRLDDRTKLAAVINYQGLRADLAKAYPNAFRAGKADRHGMQGMVVRMAGPKFGTTAETGRANVHDALIHVEHSIQDAAEINPKQQDR